MKIQPPTSLRYEGQFRWEKSKWAGRGGPALPCWKRRRLALPLVDFDELPCGAGGVEELAAVFMARGAHVEVRFAVCSHA